MRKTLNVPLEEFLRPFFEPAEKVCLRIFDDRKTGTFKGAKLETPAGQVAAMTETLKRHNEKNRGIYFVVNFGGHEDAEITRINAQFMECDELSLDEQLKQIEAFPLEPSLIVKTRKSLHTYWLIKDGDVAAFRRVQKRLAVQFHGDKTCVNESRVLRLPGFYHCKEEPVLVECIHFRPELRYTQAELEQYLPQVPDEGAAPVAATVKGSRKGLMLVERRCEFIRHCRDNAATLSEHDWYPPIMKNSLPAMKRRWTTIPAISSQRKNGNLWRSILTKVSPRQIQKNAKALTAWWPILWPEKSTLSLPSRSAALPVIQWIP